MTDELRSAHQEILPPEDSLPRAIASSELTLFGVTLHCHVLDNGQRIIDRDDFHALMVAMEYGTPRASDDESVAAAKKIAAFITGIFPCPLPNLPPALVMRAAIYSGQRITRHTTLSKSESAAGAKAAIYCSSKIVKLFGCRVLRLSVHDIHLSLVRRMAHHDHPTSRHRGRCE